MASFTELLAPAPATNPAAGNRHRRAIAEDPLWQHLDRAFRSVKGVADRTVARLMAEMPEIGTLSNKAISKLAGVAPLARDSGKHQGKRGCRRTAAVHARSFVVASVVGRYEPDFMAFQQRLRAAGKPPKVIRIALAPPTARAAPCQKLARSAASSTPSPQRTKTYPLVAVAVVGKRETRISAFSAFP